jgi:hypothetical protein
MPRLSRKVIQKSSGYGKIALPFNIVAQHVSLVLQLTMQQKTWIDAFLQIWLLLVHILFLVLLESSMFIKFYDNPNNIQVQARLIS